MGSAAPLRCTAVKWMASHAGAVRQLCRCAGVPNFPNSRANACCWTYSFANVGYLRLVVFGENAPFHVVVFAVLCQKKKKEEEENLTMPSEVLEEASVAHVCNVGNQCLPSFFMYFFLKLQLLFPHLHLGNRAPRKGPAAKKASEKDRSLEFSSHRFNGIGNPLSIFNRLTIIFLIRESIKPLFSFCLSFGLSCFLLVKAE